MSELLPCPYWLLPMVVVVVVAMAVVMAPQLTLKHPPQKEFQ